MTILLCLCALRVRFGLPRGLPLLLPLPPLMGSFTLPLPLTGLDMSVQRARCTVEGKAKFLISSCSSDLATVCSEVLRTELVRVELKGHEKLFKQSFNFSGASSFFTKGPQLIPGDALINLVPAFNSVMLELLVKATLGPIQQFLLNYTFENSPERMDVVFLQKFFGCFLDHPHASMREVYFSGVKKKPLGRGSIDVLAGKLCNDNKPQVQVKGRDQQMTKVFVWICTEAKHRSERLSANLPDSRLPQEQLDLKAFYQPIAILCSFSELCTLPNEEVPIVGLYASRYSYRPLLYFRKYDVLLTTATPFTYFDTEGRIDLHFLEF